LGDHNIGVMLTSEWFGYATVVNGRCRLRGKPVEPSVQIMASKSVQRIVIKQKQICTSLYKKEMDSEGREDV
jgi:hypothetical protein